MVLDEQELRRHLAAAADRASAPRFTIENLTSRIRRRRAKILGLVSASLLVVTAIAVAAPVALSGPDTPSAVHPSKAPFRLSFTVAVNGQSREFPESGRTPSFTVTSSKFLRIHISVIVPPHAEVTALWLGVTEGEFSPPAPNGQRPAGMRPVLARTRKVLTPGRHTFNLTWTMPAHISPGTTRWLAAAWETKQQGARVAQPVAELVTPL